MKPVPGRYNTDGPWFRGNTHLHTTASDGGKDVDTAVRLYAEAGYDFTFVTDHGHTADVEGRPDAPLLALNGVEIDGPDETGMVFHAVGLGCTRELDHEAPFGVKVRRLHETGALVVLAHPYWSGNGVADALRHPFDGVEVYNGICHLLNGKSLSAYHWDCMLARDPLALGFSVDDAHLNGNETLGHGWIMVAARELTREGVLEAIRAGRFYSTQGPLFHRIHAEPTRIRVTTSPVSMVRLVAGQKPYPGWGDRVWSGDRCGEPITKAEFTVGEGHDYLRVEIEDEGGRTAWTNVVLVRGG